MCLRSPSLCSDCQLMYGNWLIINYSNFQLILSDLQPYFIGWSKQTENMTPIENVFFCEACMGWVAVGGGMHGLTSSHSCVQNAEAITTSKVWLHSVLYVIYTGLCIRPHHTYTCKYIRTHICMLYGSVN